MKLIDKDALVAEIEKRLHKYEKEYKELAHYEIWFTAKEIEPKIKELKSLLSLLDTFEVKDPYEQCIQYPSVKDGINAHAETYSFNIESLLFNQLTKEQQALWRKEIEQACISGGEVGYELAKDPRYKENLEVKEVDLEKDVESYWKQCDMTWCRDAYSMTHIRSMLSDIAKHFFELGIKAQKGE